MQSPFANVAASIQQLSNPYAIGQHQNIHTAGNRNKTKNGTKRKIKYKIFKCGFLCFPKHDMHRKKAGYFDMCDKKNLLANK